MAAKARDCRARVAAVRALAPAIREADLVMEEPPSLPFDAGQWVSVPFGPKTVRAYSIASTPGSPRRITLCADVAPGGLGSRWFAALAPGDPVEFKGPLGGFVFSREDPRRPLFVAEEIGIVPIRSILADLYETGLGRPLRLVFWALEAGGLAYDAQFRSLARRFPGFAYHPIVPAPSSPAPDAAPALAEAVGGLVDDVADLVAYVAGGERAIRAVRDALMDRGLDRKAVKWEKFW